MDFIKHNAKAVVTFVLGVLLQAINDAAATGHPPVTLMDWLRYLGTSLIAAVIVWVTGNKLDLKQVLSGIDKLNTEDQVAVAKQTLDVLPTPVSDTVVAGYPHWTVG